MNLKTLLLDDTGAASSTRVLMIVFFLVVITMWIITCIRTKTIVDIPLGVTALGTSILALKGVQNFTERS